MRKIITIISFILFCCTSQKAIDADKLTIELDSIMEVDQKYRAQVDSVQQKYGWQSTEMSQLWERQNEIDQSNLKRILEIIYQVDGYPGKSLVGESASETAFYVLQHAPEQYYSLIISAAKNGELNKRLAAMYQDRYLMHRGDRQIFGTQIRSEFDTDSMTGGRTENTFVWPIADTTNIDSLRLLNGLGPLEGYLNSFGISRWK
jgi:hypothetical protein